MKAMRVSPLTTRLEGTKCTLSDIPRQCLWHPLKKFCVDFKTQTSHQRHCLGLCVSCHFFYQPLMAPVMCWEEEVEPVLLAALHRRLL